MKKLYRSRVIPFFLIIFLSVGFLFPVTPNQAAEFESIDGFDVHPESGRWGVTNVGFTATIDEGRFKCTDIGDTSLDYYLFKRPIRDMDGRIEVRFYLESTNILPLDFTHRFYISLHEASTTDGVLFDMQAVTNITSTTFLRYYTAGGNEVVEPIDVLPDQWYTYRIDYDLKKSDIRFRLFKGLIEVWDYIWQDIDEDAFPTIFDAQSLELQLYTSTASNSKVMTSYIDYIDAPFDERNWRHSTVGSSGNWLSQASWEFTRAQDDIDDEQIWQLNVPNLDRITGIMAIVPDDRTNMVNGDYLGIDVRIYCVDADDGDLHEAFEFYLLFYMLGGVQQVDFGVWNDGVLEYSSVQHTPTDDIGALQFIVGAKNDRSLLVYEILGKWDPTDETQNELFTGDVLTSAVATDPSQEFVIEVEYDMNFDANVNGLVVDAFIDDWEVVNNAWWLGLAVIGIGFLLAGVLLYVATGGSGGIFQPIFDIFDALVKGFGDILKPVVNWLGSIISDFFDWLFGLAQDILDFIIEIVFLIWDAVGLPDLLALLEILVDNFFDVIASLPQFITDLMEWVTLFSLILIAIWWFRVVFIAFAEADFNPFEGIANMFTYMFANALPIFYCPQCLIMIPLTFFLVFEPAGSVFFIW